MSSFLDIQEQLSARTISDSSEISHYLNQEEEVTPIRSGVGSIDQDLTDKDLKKLQQYFEDLSDDEVDEDDFITMIKSLGGFDDRTTEEFIRFFSRIDANANGGVDWDELSTYLLIGAEGQRQMNAMSEDRKQEWKMGNNEIQNLHKGHIGKIIYDQENNKYYTYSTTTYDGTIKKWNPNTLTFENTIHASKVSVTDMIHIPKYNQLAICDLHRQILFFDLNTLDIVRSFQGKIHYIESQKECIVRYKTRKPDVLSETDRKQMSPAYRKKWFNKQRDRLVGENKPKVITQKYEKIVLENLGNQQNTPHSIGLYLSPTTRKELLTIGCDSGALKIYDITKDPISTKKSLAPVYTTQAAENTILTMATSIEHNSLILGSFDSLISVYNLDKFENVSILRGHKKPVYRVDFSDTLNLIVSCGREKDAYVWNPLIPKPLERLKGHNAPVVDAQFNTRDKELITLSEDRVLKLWDIRMYKCVQTIQHIGGSNTHITSVAFNHPKESIIVGAYRHGRGSLISLPINRSHLSFKSQYNGTDYPIIDILVKEQFNECVIISEHEISTWSVLDGTLIFRFHVPEGISSAIFDHNKRRVMVTYHGQNGGMYNYINGAKLKHFQGSNKSLTEMFQMLYVEIYSDDDTVENEIVGIGGTFFVFDDSEENEMELSTLSVDMHCTSQAACLVPEKYEISNKELLATHDKNQSRESTPRSSILPQLTPSKSQLALYSSMASPSTLSDVKLPPLKTRCSVQSDVIPKYKQRLDSPAIMIQAESSSNTRQNSFYSHIHQSSNHSLLSLESDEEEEDRILTYVVLAGFDDGSLCQIDFRNGVTKIRREYDAYERESNLCTLSRPTIHSNRNFGWAYHTRQKTTCHFEKLCYLPNKHPIVVACLGNGIVEFWNALSVLRLFAFRGTTNRESICSVTTDANNNLLILGDSDGYVCIYDISAITLPDIENINFIPDITISKDQISLVCQFRAFGQTISALSYLEEQQYIFVGSVNSFVRIVDLKGNDIGFFGQTMRWNFNDSSTFAKGILDKAIMDVMVDQERIVIEKNEKESSTTHASMNSELSLDELDNLLSRKINTRYKSLARGGDGSPSLIEKSKPVMFPPIGKQTPTKSSNKDKHLTLLREIQQKKSSERDKEYFDRVFSVTNYSDRGHSFLEIDRDLDLPDKFWKES